MAEIDSSVRTNFLGPLYTMHALLPTLLSRPNGATIVTVSSVLGTLNARNLPLYSASKAALNSLHNSISYDLSARRNLKTILVAPGQLSTPLFAHVQTNGFFAPVVEASEIAKEIMKKLDAGTGGTVALPLYASVVRRGLWAVMPAWARSIARRFSGIDEAYSTSSKAE